MNKASRKITVSNLSLDNNNANKGTKRGKQLIAESLSKLGAGRSIVCDRNGKTIGGNKTLQEALALGIEIETIHTQGDKLIAVVRDDLDLDTDSKARELAFADNRTSELNLNWDVEKLLQEAKQLNLENLWTDEEVKRLEDELDLITFEGLADNNEDEDTVNVDTSSSKTESDMMPFHCLLTQEQRERLFKAINQAKSKHGVETTGEALDVITRDYLYG